VRDVLGWLERRGELPAVKRLPTLASTVALAVASACPAAAPDDWLRAWDTTPPDTAPRDTGPREEPDAYAVWPYLPIAEECGRYVQRRVDGMVMGPNSWLATDGERLVFATRTVDASPPRNQLVVIDESGTVAWQADTWQMARPLPPIIDDEGEILLVGQSTSEMGDVNGVRVQKFSRDGRELWRMLGDATVSDPLYGLYWQLGSAAAAIDESGHLYVTVGSYLKSFHSDTGLLRWQHRVIYTEMPWGAGRSTVTPLVVDDRIYILDEDYNLLALSPDGDVLVQRSAVGDAQFLPRWLTASRAGILVMTASGGGLVILDLEGEIVALADTGFGGGMGVTVATDDLGNVYAQTNRLPVVSVDRDLDLRWRGEDWSTSLSDGAIIDTDGRAGFMGGAALRPFIVFSRETGERHFGDHPGVHVTGQPVMLTPGKVWLVGRESDGQMPFLKCIEVPLGLPDPDAWATPHANFRNQRRIRSFEGAVRPGETRRARDD